MVKALVTGGSGFLGQNLVQELQEHNFDVVVFDIVNRMDDKSVPFIQGDITKEEDLTRALAGVDVVFHVASPNPLSNNRKLLFDVNVRGTETLLNTCKKLGVTRLVLTSSASVVFEGRDIANGDESLPYAKSFPNYYGETKVIQEKMVLEANGKDGMRTVALRPHGIFGPKDLLTVPSIADNARSGKLKYRIGDGKNLVDFTYVKNVALAHVLAGKKLLDDKTASVVAGKSYFVTNDEPIPFWEFMGRISTGLGYPAPSIGLPTWLMYSVAYMVGFFSWVLGMVGIKIDPTLTPYKVAISATDHYFNCTRAKRDLGYTPVVNLTDAINRTLATYPHLRNPDAKK